MRSGRVPSWGCRPGEEDPTRSPKGGPCQARCAVRAGPSFLTLCSRSSSLHSSPLSTREVCLGKGSPEQPWILGFLGTIESQIRPLLLSLSPHPFPPSTTWSALRQLVLSTDLQRAPAPYWLPPCFPDVGVPPGGWGRGPKLEASPLLLEPATEMQTKKRGPRKRPRPQVLPPPSPGTARGSRDWKSP